MAYPRHVLHKDGEHLVLFLAAVVLDNPLVLEVSQQLELVLQGSHLLVG